MLANDSEARTNRVNSSAVVAQRKPKTFAVDVDDNRASYNGVVGRKAKVPNRHESLPRSLTNHL